MRLWHEFGLPLYSSTLEKLSEESRGINDERVRLTEGDDTYQAGDGGEFILGLGGADRIGGGRGDDTIKGGKGDDSVGGSLGSDTLFGGAGADIIGGGAGRDVLYGGAGDDILGGGNRGDTLCGGAGADEIHPGTGGVNGLDHSDGARDTLIYLAVSDSTADAADRIYNFGQQTDRVDLSSIDADTSTPENDAFHYIKDAAFSGTPGELRFGDAGPFGTTLLEADVDGDGRADLVVQFNLSGNNDTLHERNFVL